MEVFIDEKTENLITDIEVDGHGWLRSKSIHSSSIHEDDDSSSSNNDQAEGEGKSESKSKSNDSQNSKNSTVGDLPELYPSCVKLLSKINYVHSTDAGTDVSADDEAKEEVNALQELDFAPDLYDTAVTAISHVMKMSAHKRSPRSRRSKSGHASRDGNHNNLSSVEKDLVDWVEVKTKNDLEEENDTPCSASECTQITLNTMSILVPILAPMLNHPCRSDFSLQMKHGPSIKKKGHQGKDKNKELDGNIMAKSTKKTKTQTYIFFGNTYSVTTTRAFDLLKRDAMKLFGVVDNLLLRAAPAMTEYSQIGYVVASLFQEEAKFMNRDVSKVREFIIQRTLLTSLDPDAEIFAHEMDKAIIHPLAENRGYLKQDHDNSVHLLHKKLSQILSNRMKGAVLDIYGSCLSGLSLGNSSDVDISLYIPEAYTLKTKYLAGRMERQEYQKKLKKFVYRVHDSVHPNRGGRDRRDRQKKTEFSSVEAVPYARVPVIKGNYLHANNPFTADGSLHFDICILNDIAVANSALLREYSLIDPRVRMLMLSVKSWVKFNSVGSAAENTLSSYTWMVLVIFYLQCIDFVPVLQCPYFMEKHGKEFNPNDRMHTINDLRTVFLNSTIVKEHNIWTQPEKFRTTPVAGLLAGFFIFYSRYFPQETTAVSIRLGNLSLQKSTFRSSRLWRLCIEDPFETHDCHCPHDLGTPMDENGQLKVTKALKEAADSMESMLIDCDKIQDCIGSFKYTQPIEKHGTTIMDTNGKSQKNKKQINKNKNDNYAALQKNGESSITTNNESEAQQMSGQPQNENDHKERKKRDRAKRQARRDANKENDNNSALQKSATTNEGEVQQMSDQPQNENDPKDWKKRDRMKRQARRDAKKKELASRDGTESSGFKKEEGTKTADKGKDNKAGEGADGKNVRKNHSEGNRNRRRRGNKGGTSKQNDAKYAHKIQSNPQS